MTSSTTTTQKTAFQFIILLGVVSLFGDITYEGARSITGPYLAMLGASAGIVGLAAGLGEFIGYSLRLPSGYFADRTRAYWPITFIGYGLILSIPMLGLAGTWQTAVVLIVLERMGKAVRTPARDAILSHAAKQVGRGFGFGIHEALDQLGAFIGPMIFTVAFLLNGSYRQGFTVLWIPAFLALTFLFFARLKVASPEKLETPSSGQAGKNRLPTVFWLYTMFSFLSVAGFANFQLISYHFKVNAVVPDIQIPLFYAAAMAVDALVALIIGRAYDRSGFLSLITIPVLCIPIPFFAFSHSYAFSAVSIILWGAVMGAHETIMRAAIADIAPSGRRAFAYGIFNTAYGIAWFLGSALMGFLYEVSISYIIIFSVIMEAASIVMFFFMRGHRPGGHRPP